MKKKGTFILLVLLWGLIANSFAASLPKGSYNEGSYNQMSDPFLQRIVDVEDDVTNSTYWADYGSNYEYIPGSFGGVFLDGDTVSISGTNTYILHRTPDAQALGPYIYVLEAYDVVTNNELGSQLFINTSDVPLGDNLLPILLLLIPYISYRKIKKKKTTA